MIKIGMLLSETVLDTTEIRTTLKQRATQQETVLKRAIEDTGARINKRIDVGTMVTVVSSHPKKPEVEYSIRAHIVVDYTDNKALTVIQTGTFIARVGSSGLPEFHHVPNRIICKDAGKEVWNEKVSNRALTNTLYKMFKDLRSSNVLTRDEKIVGPHGPSKPPIGTRTAAVPPYDSGIAG